ncbi:MAG: DUF4349 domain-containing protein [Nocardioides sp.]
MTSPLTPRRLRAAAAVALVATLTVACSTAGEDSADGGSDADMSQVAPEAAVADMLRGDVDAEVPADAAAYRAESAQSNLSNGSVATADDKGAAPVAADAGRALIKTGTVALRSSDVGQARFDVQKIVDAHRGEIAEENTEADDEGDAERSRLVIRVPVAEYTAVLQELEDVAELISTSSSIEDVSTQVIDTGVRVQLQRRSIERISLLLDRASSIRDIVNIERELSRREADLGSLEKRQTFLRDQSQQATVTVSIERPREKDPVEKKEKDDDGFLSGLENGWHALSEVTTGLLTASGALLPFALVLLLVGVPARAVWRRRRPIAPTAPQVSG